MAGPSLPPSLLSGVLLLQFHDDVSDAEAVQRLQFDLRWQVALNLPTDYPGFDPTSLGNFRERLAEHGQERYGFDRFVAVGRAAGFIGFNVAVTTEQSSELIVDIQDIPATGSDGQALMPTVEQVAQHAGVTVEQVIGDGAYGSGANRAACAAAQVDLLD